MRFDPEKSKIENWLNFGIELVKTFFLFWLLIPVMYFIWKCSP